MKDTVNNNYNNNNCNNNDSDNLIIKVVIIITIITTIIIIIIIVSLRPGNTGLMSSCRKSHLIGKGILFSLGWQSF